MSERTPVHHRSLAGGQDRPVPLALSRTGRRLSPPLREPQDRQVGLSAGLRATSGSRACARSPRSSAPTARTARSCPSPTTSIRWHLSGRDDAGRDFVMGVYPMLAGRDLLLPGRRFRQGHIGRRTWRPCWRRAAAWSLPAAVERSRSGHGGHVWLFFAEPFPPRWPARLGRTF